MHGLRSPPAADLTSLSRSWPWLAGSPRIFANFVARAAARWTLATKPYWSCRGQKRRKQDCTLPKWSHHRWPRPGTAAYVLSGGSDHRSERQIARM